MKAEKKIVIFFPTNISSTVRLIGGFTVKVSNIGFITVHGPNEGHIAPIHCKRAHQSGKYFMQWRHHENYWNITLKSSASFHCKPRPWCRRLAPLGQNHEMLAHAQKQGTASRFWTLSHQPYAPGCRTTSWVNMTRIAETYHLQYMWENITMTGIPLGDW